jgi:hypothetical protein
MQKTRPSRSSVLCSFNCNVFVTGRKEERWTLPSANNSPVRVSAVLFKCQACTEINRQTFNILCLDRGRVHLRPLHSSAVWREPQVHFLYDVWLHPVGWKRDKTCICRVSSPVLPSISHLLNYRSHICVLSLDVSQAASVADTTVAGAPIHIRGRKFSLYHHVQTVSAGFCHWARRATNVELFYVPIIHHDSLLLRLGQIRNNAHFSFLVSTYTKVEKCPSNCHAIWW